MSQFKINLINENNFPSISIVSAVFLIGIKDDKILIIKNERGWDIPGGHVENGEKLEHALKREVLEEASAKFKQAKPYLYLSDEGRTVMLFYFVDDFDLKTFVPCEDSFDRDILSIEDFIEKYYGDKKLVRRMIEIAQGLIKKSKITK